MLNIYPIFGLDNCQNSRFLFWAAAAFPRPLQAVTLRNRTLVASSAGPLRAPMPHSARPARRYGSRYRICAAKPFNPVRINLLFPEISRPAVPGSAAPVPRLTALGRHLVTQEHRQADEEGDADYQRWSQRREVGQHSEVHSTASGARCCRWACSPRAQRRSHFPRPG